MDLLNASLTIELTAVNQYFLAAEQCANWGFPRLRERFRAISLDEMKDIEVLVKHILYLEGLPNMQRLNRVMVGESFATIIDAAIGETQLADRAAVIGTLAHVMDSVIGIWLAQRHDGAWVRRELDAAVRVLLSA